MAVGVKPSALQFFVAVVRFRERESRRCGDRCELCTPFAHLIGGCRFPAPEILGVRDVVVIERELYVEGADVLEQWAADREVIQHPRIGRGREIRRWCERDCAGRCGRRAHRSPTRTPLPAATPGRAGSAFRLHHPGRTSGGLGAPGACLALRSTLAFEALDAIREVRRFRCGGRDPSRRGAARGLRSGPRSPYRARPPRSRASSPASRGDGSRRTPRAARPAWRPRRSCGPSRWERSPRPLRAAR